MQAEIGGSSDEDWEESSKERPPLDDARGDAGSTRGSAQSKDGLANLERIARALALEDPEFVEISENLRSRPGTSCGTAATGPPLQARNAPPAPLDRPPDRPQNVEPTDAGALSPGSSPSGGGEYDESFEAISDVSEESFDADS